MFISQLKPISTVNLKLMRHIDEQHLEYPFMGARMLRDQLNQRGFVVRSQACQYIDETLGIEALCKKPNTSKKHPGLKSYPHLLRNLVIEEATRFGLGHWTQFTSQRLTSRLLWMYCKRRLLTMAGQRL